MIEVVSAFRATREGKLLGRGGNRAREAQSESGGAGDWRTAGAAPPPR